MLALSIPRTLFAEVKHFFFHHIVRTIFPNTACTLVRNTAAFPRQVRKCVHKRRCFPRTHRRLSTALSAGFPQTWLDLHSKSADVSAHTSVFPRHCLQVWPQTPHFAHNSFRPIVCKTTVHVHNSVGTNTSTAKCRSLCGRSVLQCYSVRQSQKPTIQKHVHGGFVHNSCSITKSMSAVVSAISALVSTNLLLTSIGWILA